MSHEADELVLYADNDEPLYRQSFMPIVANLKKKLAKGTYDPHLAAKLWRYHADRAAQKYVKEFGGGTWHKVFSTKDRNEAAAHWEQYARREYLGVSSHDRSRAARARRDLAANRKRKAKKVGVLRAWRRAAISTSKQPLRKPKTYAKHRDTRETAWQIQESTRGGWYTVGGTYGTKADAEQAARWLYTTRSKWRVVRVHPGTYRDPARRRPAARRTVAKRRTR